jgi:hypothetical protein
VYFSKQCPYCICRLGRLLNEPPPPDPSSSPSPAQSPSVFLASSAEDVALRHKNSVMRNEWIQWIRSEFRMRQASASTDEEMTRALLAYGKRQLQEMERSIMLAVNQNNPPNPIRSASAATSSTKSGSTDSNCSSKNKDNKVSSSTQSS